MTEIQFSEDCLLREIHGFERCETIYEVIGAIGTRTAALKCAADGINCFRGHEAFSSRSGQTASLRDNSRDVPRFRPYGGVRWP